MAARNINPLLVFFRIYSTIVLRVYLNIYVWGSWGRGAGPLSFSANQFAGIDRARISIDVTQGIYIATLDAHALEY